MPNPNAFAAQLTNQVKSPLQRAGEYQNMLASQQQNTLRDQQLQQNKLALGQQQQQVGDEQAVREAWKMAGGDKTKFLQAIGQTAPHLVHPMSQKFATEDLEFRNKMIDGAAKVTEYVSQEIGSLKALSPEARAQRWAAMKPQLVQLGINPSQLPDAVPDDAFIDSSVLEGMKTVDQLKAQQEAAKIKETGRHNQATETQADAVLGETRRHNKESERISGEANNINAQLKDAQLQKVSMENQQTQIGRQKVLADIDNAIKTVDRVGAHEGLSAVVGMKNPLGGSLGSMSVPGSRAADFRAELATLKSQTFLQSIQAMRGTGPLSDREGAKVESAIAALDENQSEESFRKALIRIKGSFEGLKKVYEAESGFKGNAPQPQPTQAEPTAVGPNGHTIVFRNGAWIDAQTGQPLQ
jgi:hypothetical protein